MRGMVVLLGLLLLGVPACQRLATDSENLRQFDGSWVVDLPASMELSPSLLSFPDRQAYLRTLVMIINMPSRQIIMGQGRHQNRDPFNFILLQEEPGQARIQLEAGEEIVLRKQNTGILYNKSTTPEETLLFKPMFNLNEQ